MWKIIHKQDGFTLYEIIAVLIVLGILVAVVASRGTSVQADAYTGADALKTHIRYAQTLAMNSNPNNTGTNDTFFGIKCDGTKYWLFRGANPDTQANWVRLPEDEKYLDANLAVDLAKKKISVSSFTVIFNQRGVPHSPNAATPLASNLTISVGPVQVMITPLTGYVP